MMLCIIVVMYTYAHTGGEPRSAAGVDAEDDGSGFGVLPPPSRGEGEALLGRPSKEDEAVDELQYQEGDSPQLERLSAAPLLSAGGVRAWLAFQSRFI